LVDHLATYVDDLDPDRMTTAQAADHSRRLCEAERY
jgi:hypothetical protein